MCMWIARCQVFEPQPNALLPLPRFVWKPNALAMPLIQTSLPPLFHGLCGFAENSRGWALYTSVQAALNASVCSMLETFEVYKKRRPRWTQRPGFEGTMAQCPPMADCGMNRDSCAHVVSKNRRLKIVTTYINSKYHEIKEYIFILSNMRIIFRWMSCGWWSYWNWGLSIAIQDWFALGIYRRYRPNWFKFESHGRQKIQTMATEFLGLVAFGAFHWKVSGTDAWHSCHISLQVLSLRRLK